MPRRFAHLLLVLAAVIAAGTAFAQGPSDIAIRLFARLDSDRSGAVTAAEFSVMRGLDFQRLDRNKDGYLGRDEFIEKRSPRDALSARARRLRSLRVRRFAGIDEDRDGRIARREYMTFGRRLFARLDRNGDGKLTLPEVRGSLSSSTRRQTGGLFGQLDIDRDGTISLEELLAARKIVFRRLDTDKNGTISAVEFAAREAAIAAPPGSAPPPRSALPSRASRRFRQLDRDQDGQVTVREYLADGKVQFAAADRDANGRLDQAEFEGGAGR